MTADRAQINKPYSIISIEESEFNQRLIEMGCIEGTQITKVFQAIGGDPIAFQIDGYVLALRKSEAKTITIK